MRRARPGRARAEDLGRLGLRRGDRILWSTASSLPAVVANIAALSDANAKKVTASIMGVEAQHAAILRAVQALVAGNAAADIALPPPVANLPAAAGSVGFPDAFFPTTQARPATEGALS